MTRDRIPTAALRGLMAACLAACLFSAGAFARAASAVASLAASETAVGDPVEFKVQVEGATQVEWSGSLQVDGLEIRGPRVNPGFGGLGGLGMGGGMTLLFSVTPTREGEFTIPSITLRANNTNFRTEPVKLVVRAGLKKSGGDGEPPGSLEIVVSQSSAYVGEMVPVEIRLSVDSRIRWQPQAMPEISGEGFTKQKLPEPRRGHGSKDGNEMDVVVFRTAITPSKAGTIMLGPIEVPYLAQVPRAQKQKRAHSLLDLFDDSVFGDPFFSANQPYKARADAVNLEVKPLPAAGRPQNFSGAVGDFKFSGSGAPSRVKVGDPITMKLSVSGRGNFDRMDAPALVDPAGWRSYPASGDFKPDDDLGIHGMKTFTVAVVPETVKNAMPVFGFAYFDPAAEKYVTLTSEPEQLIVEGTAPLPATPAPAESRRAEPPPPAPARDILGIRYDAGGGRKSFEPLYRNRGFLLAQVVPLAALLALVFFQWRKTNFERERRAEWTRERAAALGKLRGGELEDSRFLELAAEVIQKEVALSSNRLPGSVDATAACASRQLDGETREGIEMIFNARAEALYAGTNEPAGRLSAEQRRAVLTTLETFERSRPRA